MIVHLDHPNTPQVRRAAIALGGLLTEVVFVGGLMVPFFITDRGLHRMRPTDDVDVLVQCRTRHAYHQFAQRLQSAGFRVDQTSGAPLCRDRTTGNRKRRRHLGDRRRLHYWGHLEGGFVSAPQRLPSYVPVAGAAVARDTNGNSAGRRIDWTQRSTSVHAFGVPHARRRTGGSALRAICEARLSFLGV